MALLMAFLRNVLICIKKVKLINHNNLPTLMLMYIMLHVMLAYLMLFAVLSNADFLHSAFLYVTFVFMLCLCLLTHSLFISNIILHHAQCL